ncbi:MULTISPECIES: c-type cytochrome [Flavobacterium]|uniref:C-type cytochrome n=1 Tax=Flavobacterium jumunjinense TaxID=998845 RepID=A0ABV5GQN3_9FLAO|nr:MULTISPECIES: cytochrome c [Flavobacterium]
MKKVIASFLFILLCYFSFSSFSSYENEKYTKTTELQDVNNGKKLYEKSCIMCHKASGEGYGTSFPPLAKSDFLNADTDRAIRIVIYGIQEPIVVNGKKYENFMIPHKDFSDQDVADVLTYVYSNWGNNKTKVTAEMVKKQRTKK